MSGICPVCSARDIRFFCSAFDRVRRQPDKQWGILQCNECKFGWTDPPLPENEIASHYPPAYLGDTRRMIEEFQSGQLAFSRSWKKETEKIRLVERFVKSGKLVDIGCAEGKFLWALDPARWDRYGVEFSAEVVKLVRSSLEAVNFITGDIYSDKLKKEFFDVITFWHVLEHLPNPERVLQRIRLLLRPGGWLFISLPNINSWQACWFRRHWYAFDDVPRHLYHFSPQSLRLLLRKTGFSVVEQVFFSRIVNFHSWKYTVINWAEANFGTRIPYYLAKPFFPILQALESWSDRYGMFTLISRRV